MGRGTSKRWLPALVGVVTLLVPASAAATTRYAAPGGTATAAECTTPTTPCTIYEAAQGTGVTSGDEVVIATGNYSDTAGDLGPNHYVDPVANLVHGAPGQARPVITMENDDNSGFGAFKVEAGNTISHLEIDATGSQTNINLTGGLVEDLIARSSNGFGPIACRFSGSATLRDSACIATGSQGRAAGSFITAAGTHTITLRNVTAVGSGPFLSNSIALDFGGNGAGITVNVDAKSVIASGSTFDVYGQEFNGAEVTITLDHSNFSGFGSQGSPTISSPFANSNQVTEPVLASDSIHQLSNSPTVNAGAALDGSSGSSDIDGQFRNIGGAPDIGADELGHQTTTEVSCAPASVSIGSSTTCTGTVTDTASAGATPPTGTVAFSSDTPGGALSSGGTCTLVTVSPASASCSMSYAPGQSGSGTHQVTGEYGADTTHDPSQDSAFVLVDVFLTSPPPPTAVPGSTPVVDPCPPLRKKLKKAKKAGNKPKVRKLKRRLRALGC